MVELWHQVAAELHQLAPNGQLGSEASQEELLSGVIPLSSGAQARLTGPTEGPVVVCVGGGSSKPRAGDWGATLEWLVRKLSPRFPRVGFVEVRYRVRSWRELESCIEDANAALAHAVDAGADRCALLGFSMGGAVAVAGAEHDAVSHVIGLAPWLPDRLDGTTLRDRHLAVVHGQLDTWLPFIPGVSATRTRLALERFADDGVSTSYTLVRGGVHGLALRAPWGGLLRLPRAGAWVDPISDALRGFRDGEKVRRT